MFDYPSLNNSLPTCNFKLKMEKIIETFNALDVKAANIAETMIVLPHKPVLMEQLQKLSGDEKEMKDLAQEVNKSLKDHETIVKNEFKETTKVLNRIQLKMIYLLQHFEDERKPGSSPSGPPSSSLSFLGLRNSSIVSKPPLLQVKKLQLNFSDFEADITIEEFFKIPSYIRGRTVLSELLGFLDNVMIRTFNEKYQIHQQKPQMLKPAELKLYHKFKADEKLFDGLKFVTAEDIVRVIGKNVYNKVDKLLQMLRALHIIREARKSSSICYIWLKK